MQAVRGVGMASNSEVEQWCQETIGRNEASWEDFKNGESGALNFLVGQVMALSEGRADPGEVAETFRSLHTHCEQGDPA